jgi:hypothetical protein
VPEQDVATAHGEPFLSGMALDRPPAREMYNTPRKKIDRKYETQSPAPREEIDDLN